MTGHYTVAFSVTGEPTHVDFEQTESAGVFARDIDGIGYEPVMYDEERITYDYDQSPPVKQTHDD